MVAVLAQYKDLFTQSTLDTLYMTFVSTFLAYIIGLPLGVLFTITKKGGIAQMLYFNTVFGWFINILRSLPFIILMIFIAPFTRFIAGTTIGSTAAIIPLVIAAIPFIARMVETSLEEVNPGLIEAAQCMGATNFQVIYKVLLVESTPSLLRGASISTITILGYTAITGTIGAGGLGDLAYRYGYQRHETQIMYVTVIILIILVCIIQGVFNLLARSLDKRNR